MLSVLIAKVQVLGVGGGEDQEVMITKRASSVEDLDTFQMNKWDSIRD